MDSLNVIFCLTPPKLAVTTNPLNEFGGFAVFNFRIMKEFLKLQLRLHDFKISFPRLWTGSLVFGVEGDKFLTFQEMENNPSLISSALTIVRIE